MSNLEVVKGLIGKVTGLKFVPSKYLPEDTIMISEELYKRLLECEELLPVTSSEGGE